MPLSPQEVAKRAFVSLLLLLARSYSLVVDVRRGSPDADVLRAFKRARALQLLARQAPEHSRSGQPLLSFEKWMATDLRTHTHTHMKLHSRQIHSGVMKVRAV